MTTDGQEQPAGLAVTFDVINEVRYYPDVIKSFRCKDTERLFKRERVKRFRNIEQSARRKLEMLDAAVALADLKVPPGNRLEALKGDRIGHHSIRINDQWRLCFAWRSGNAENVEIVDYHN